MNCTEKKSGIWYAIEADAKPNTNMIIPKRISYVDSEGRFITASDQFDRNGALWKSLVNFITYEDRAAPGRAWLYIPTGGFSRSEWSIPISIADTRR
jgi:hypothetical protein